MLKTKILQGFNVRAVRDGSTHSLFVMPNYIMVFLFNKRITFIIDAQQIFPLKTNNWSLVLILQSKLRSGLNPSSFCQPAIALTVDLTNIVEI